MAARAYDWVFALALALDHGPGLAGAESPCTVLIPTVSPCCMHGPHGSMLYRLDTGRPPILTSRMYEVSPKPQRHGKSRRHQLHLAAKVCAGSDLSCQLLLLDTDQLTRCIAGSIFAAAPHCQCWGYRPARQAFAAMAHLCKCDIERGALGRPVAPHRSCQQSCRPRRAHQRVHSARQSVHQLGEPCHDA